MTPQELTLASKYAKAFLNLFIDEVSLKDYKHLATLEQFLKDRREALAFLALPHIDPVAKQKALASVIEKFGLPDCFNRLVNILVKSGRSFLFPSILRAIAQLYRKRKGIEDFVIQSSSPLDEQSLHAIETFLAYKTNEQILSDHEINTTLIAGIRLKSENYLWEYSVAKKLRSIMMSPLE